MFWFGAYRPLSEGKALKAKFDDIFASTRYTKALENTQKLHKEQVCAEPLWLVWNQLRLAWLFGNGIMTVLEWIWQAQECKLFETDLHHLKQKKDQAEEVLMIASIPVGRVSHSGPAHYHAHCPTTRFEETFTGSSRGWTLPRLRSLD